MFTASKYYRMSDSELEAEGRKWNIAGGLANGHFDKQFVIGELIKKDKANDSSYAIIISILALVISVAVLFIK